MPGVQLEKERQAAAAAAESGGHQHGTEVLTVHAPVAASPAAIDGSRTTKWAVFLLAFSSVFREGVESVIFLAGVSGAAAPTAIPLSAVVGIICGCLVGVALYYSCAPTFWVYAVQDMDLAVDACATCECVFFAGLGCSCQAGSRRYRVLCDVLLM